MVKKKYHKKFPMAETVVVLLIIAIILSFGKKWKLVAVLLVLAAILNWWAECIPLRLWQINENGNDRTVKVMSFI